VFIPDSMGTSSFVLVGEPQAMELVASPSDTGIRQARAKTDRLDARTLARLLRLGRWTLDAQALATISGGSTETAP
jgi:hypothetical protein